MSKRALNYLGIAKRSGNLVCGTDMVVSSLPTNKLKLIFLANDASENTKDKITKKAFFYKLEVIDKFSSSELSKAIGKDHIMVMALIDDGLTKAFLKEIEREVAYEG